MDQDSRFDRDERLQVQSMAGFSEQTIGRQVLRLMRCLKHKFVCLASFASASQL